MINAIKRALGRFSGRAGPERPANVWIPPRPIDTSKMAVPSQSAATPPNPVAVARTVLSALGLDPERIVSLTIELRAGKLPTITATTWLLEDQAERFSEERWTLIPEDK